MDQRIVILTAALGLGISGATAACDGSRGQRVAVDSPAVERALAELHADQRRQVQMWARRSLAQMHSQAATAVAQGATTAATLSINTGP
jgi:hypothetical protein